MRGVLCQLQSTLMDTKLLTVTAYFNLLTCAQRAKNFSCTLCGNLCSQSKPNNNKKEKPNFDHDSLARESFEMPKIVRVTVFNDTTRKNRPLPMKRNNTATNLERKQEKQEKAIEETKSKNDDWTVVTSSPSSSSSSSSYFSNTTGSYLHTKKPFAYSKCKEKDVSKCTTSSSSCLSTKNSNSFNLIKNFNKARGVAKVTKSSLKNQRRRERKRLQKLAALNDSALLVNEEKSSKTDDNFTTTTAISAISTNTITLKKIYHQLEKLPRHLLVLLLGFTDVSDVQALSCCSMRLRTMSTDGWMWRQLFSRTKQATNMKLDNCSDWRRLYDLHLSTCVTSSLKCFYTKVSFNDDVLGVPLDFTRNPRTGRTDYISIYCDSIISKTAWHEHNIRTTAWNEKALCFLPLYISEDHFQRALPAIKLCISQVAGMANSCSVKSRDAFRPSMVLDVIPQAMKTLALLLATKAESVSSIFADALVQLHRLFVALINVWPQLRYDIRDKLKCFIRGDQHDRSKDVFPSLGDLFPLLSVCPEYTYDDLLLPYWFENLDRGVIWVFREYPELSKRSLLTLGQGKNQELLDKSFEGRKVSNRVFLVNRAILKCLLKPASFSIADTCQKNDYLLGHATPKAKKEFVKCVSQALNISSWKDMLCLSGIRMKNGMLPSPATVTDWLKKSVENSERRGYHQRGMNFSKIHKSGGSRLLRKGEGQSLGSVSTIKLNDSWRWDTNQMFLDATILSFDWNSKHKSTLDYARTQSRGLNHSGDVMDHINCKGRHTIDIDLHRVPKCIQSLVIVLSAFDDSTMEKALQPNVAVVDTDSGSELCRYELEAKQVALKGMKNVVMCRIHRAQPGSSWTVEAIGSIGAFGDATNYDPIIKSLEATYKPADTTPKNWREK